MAFYAHALYKLKYNVNAIETTTKNKTKKLKSLKPNNPAPP
ncbi:hypothetical protein Vsou_02450 [Vulcanisaeta souniana JCM 11219]|uniref:Uncharacterized protein n=1 Tax=Vulcanisaeta souniana JCM 11219 TaxID=1293586 RepID=A0ABM8BJP2_9CREN|nr:hypothetical protein Vsou_02450 [Vulcanisaeta souniana JCM 11219]